MYGYENPYMQGMNPYMMQNQQPQPMQTTRQEVVKVNGENGARAYQMPPNSSALLLDESGLLVWLAVSDGAGYKTVTAYDITPHQSQPAPDYSSLELRITRLEEMISNGNSGNFAAAGTKRTGKQSATDKTDV